MNSIKDKRIKSGIKQREVAKELRINRSTVTKWEQGISNPRAEMLVKLSKLFGCTVDELLSDTEEQQTM